MENKIKELLILQLGEAISNLRKRGIVHSGKTTAFNWAIHKGQIVKLTYYIPEEGNTEGDITINPQFGQISHQLKFHDPFLHVFKINYYIDLDYFSIDNDEVDNEIGSLSSRVSIDSNNVISYLQKRDLKSPNEYVIYKNVIQPNGEEKTLIYCFSKSDLPDDVDELLWTLEIVNNNRQFVYPSLPNNGGSCTISVIEQKTVCSIINKEGVKSNISIEMLHRYYPEAYRAYYLNLAQIDIDQIDSQIRKSISDVSECPLPIINEQLKAKLDKIKNYLGHCIVVE